MKTAIVIFAAAFLAGCTPTAKEVSDDFALPDGLKDCKVFVLDGRDTTRLYVVRCGETVMTQRRVSKSTIIRVTTIGGEKNDR